MNKNNEKKNSNENQFEFKNKGNNLNKDLNYNLDNDGKSPKENIKKFLPDKITDKMNNKQSPNNLSRKVSDNNVDVVNTNKNSEIFDKVIEHIDI